MKYQRNSTSEYSWDYCDLKLQWQETSDSMSLFKECGNAFGLLDSLGGSSIGRSKSRS
jgi:hypothetical protein